VLVNHYRPILESWKDRCNGSERQMPAVRRVAVECERAGTANASHRLSPELDAGREGAMHIARTLGAGEEVETGPEGNSPCFFRAGFHGDLDVLAEGGEKVHETLDGKVTVAVAHQAET